MPKKTKTYKSDVMKKHSGYNSEGKGGCTPRSESGKPPEATNQPIDRPTTRNHSTTRNHTPKFSGACGGLNQCSITRVYPLFVFLTIVSQQKQIASINITGSIQVVINQMNQ